MLSLDGGNIDVGGESVIGASMSKIVTGVSWAAEGADTGVLDAILWCCGAMERCESRGVGKYLRLRRCLI